MSDALDYVRDRNWRLLCASTNHPIIDLKDEKHGCGLYRNDKRQPKRRLSLSSISSKMTLVGNL